MSQNLESDHVIANEIAAQIAQFERDICARAEKHSLSWVPGYEIDPNTKPGEFMSFLSHAEQWVSVEKRNGVWSLWYTNAGVPFKAVTGKPERTNVLLRDASLLVRQAFMQRHAKKFAMEFVKMCKQLREQREGALTAGREALAFLNDNQT